MFCTVRLCPLGHEIIGGYIRYADFCYYPACDRWRGSGYHDPVPVRQEPRPERCIGGIADSYMSKAKAKTLDAKLARSTKWVGAAFVVLTLVINCMVAAGL